MVPTQNLSAQTEAQIPLGVNDRSSLSLPVHLVLEITRGRTRFPRRPVTHSRFLIGAGATCDLRLGGERMPALHSIITVAGREITLEAIAAEPGLTVNGRLVRNALLHDGDLIGIGEVELLARLEAGHAPAAIEQPAAATRRPTLTSIDHWPTFQRPSSSSSSNVKKTPSKNSRIASATAPRRWSAPSGPASIAPTTQETTGAKSGSRAPVPAPHFLSKRPQILAGQPRQPASTAAAEPAATGRH